MCIRPGHFSFNWKLIGRQLDCVYSPSSASVPASYHQWATHTHQPLQINPRQKNSGKWEVRHARFSGWTSCCTSRRTGSMYVFNAWPETDVTSAGGCEVYLRRQTGISDDATRAYLLFDEAQESYTILGWYHVGFVLQNDYIMLRGCPKLILFASYGTPGRGNANQVIPMKQSWWWWRTRKSRYLAEWNRCIWYYGQVRTCGRSCPWESGFNTIRSNWQKIMAIRIRRIRWAKTKAVRPVWSEHSPGQATR